MALGRKELIIDEQDESRKELTSKEIDEMNEGVALAQMKESYGWKLLWEDFIQPRLSIHRILSAKTEDLADERAAIRELNALVAFIEQRIKVAEKKITALHTGG